MWDRMKNIILKISGNIFSISISKNISDFVQKTFYSLFADE